MHWNLLFWVKILVLYSQSYTSQVHTINTDYDWNLQYLGCITLTVVCITAWRHNVWACEHLSCHHSRFLSSFILLYTTTPHQAEKVIICSIIFCEYYGRQLLKIFQEIFISVEKFPGNFRFRHFLILALTK